LPQTISATGNWGNFLSIYRHVQAPLVNSDRRNSMMSQPRLLGASVIVLAALLSLAGCGGNNASTPSDQSMKGMVTVSISDPPTCGSSSDGPFLHVWVTITDVKINASSSAGDNDAGWIDLTPNLKNSPQQVDLLAAATNQCFLATLGSIGLQAGSYQQIRIILADNSAPPANNNCHTTPASANCVVLASDGSFQVLNLSSESRTGIKIPSGQIAGGQFTIANGQTKDLNIDFDACASIVTEGHGRFRLKPVLHAGEVSTTSSSINGTLVDNATGQPIAGGKSIVALEQASGGIDRVIMQTTPDAAGNFVFCPVPAGTYDVVAVAVNGAGVSYAANITTGVVPGNALGNVPMNAVTGANTSQGSIVGMITTASAGSAGAAADLTVSALQAVSSVQITIPLAQQSSATATLSTVPGAACPTNTDCASYTLDLPGVNPTVGAFSSTGTSYAAGAAGAASYVVDAQAFVPSSGGTADCSPSEMSIAAQSVTPGNVTNAPTLAFTGCQ
jgi:Domain of unknown function (DUF4382)